MVLIMSLSFLNSYLYLKKMSSKCILFSGFTAQDFVKGVGLPRITVAIATLDLSPWISF